MDSLIKRAAYSRAASLITRLMRRADTADTAGVIGKSRPDGSILSLLKSFKSKGSALLEQDLNNPVVVAGELLTAGGMLHHFDKHVLKKDKSIWEPLAFPWEKTTPEKNLQ